MATNLYSLLRYRTIDKCLHNREEAWTWERLAEACTKAIEEEKGETKNISRRTIMYDIKNMRNGELGYDAPIEYDRKEKSYYYTNSSFSIDNIPLKREQMDDLQNALLIIKQFAGKENVMGLQKIVASLEATLNITKPGKKREIIQFDHSLNEKGQKWLNIIYDFIKDRETITIEYQPFDKDPMHIKVSPYLLKEYNNRWFLIAYNHEYKGISNYGLDRIIDVKASFEPYFKMDSFDQERFLNEIIGVSIPPDSKKAKVVFRAYGRQRLYIETKRLHESQETVKMTDEYGEFSLSVIPNFELESKLLAYGERIEVLKPKVLRDKFKNRIIKAKTLYS